MSDRGKLNLKVVARALNAQPEAVCSALGFGTPIQRSRLTIRYGRKGSLLIHDAGERRGRFYDFETGDHGDMLDLVRREAGDNWSRALEWVRRFLGDDLCRVSAPVAPGPEERRRARVPPNGWHRTEALWNAARPLSGTLGESYLRQRGLELPAIADGHVLRFHPAVPSRALTGETVKAPAMIALMREPVSGRPCGVHRTFLTPHARKHPELGKRMLGTAGVIMIDPDEAVTEGLCVAEGIETALSVRGHYGFAPVWAAGSAHMLRQFPVLAGIECLHIFADHDVSGTGEGAAIDLGRRWKAANREVRISRPSWIGDWADRPRKGLRHAA